MKFLIFRHPTHPWVHFSSRDIVHELFPVISCHGDTSQVSYIWSRDFRWFLNLQMLDRTSLSFSTFSNFNCSLFIRFPKYPGKSYGSYFLSYLLYLLRLLFSNSGISCKTYTFNLIFCQATLIWIFALFCRFQISKQSEKLNFKSV